MPCNGVRQEEQLPEELEPAHQPRCEGLLEDWPRRASSLASEADDHAHDAASNSDSAAQPSVNISKSSRLYVYYEDDLYCMNKAYSRRDREIFGAQAMIEANRIKTLIYTSPSASVKESVKYLLQNNIVTIDEMVGIDHMIIGRRTAVLQVRRDHMMAVLRKQQELRGLQQQHTQLEEDSLIALCKFAEQSSLKSTHSAIARATLTSSSP